MCKTMKEECEEFSFAHAFLTLKWNLMARSENVVHAHYFNFHWDADCRVLLFVKSKDNQKGWNNDQE